MYKWFLESPPLTCCGGSILFSRSFNVFFFFTDEEKESHLLKDKMREINQDKFALYQLQQALGENAIQL